MPAAIPFIVAAGYAYAATTAVGVVAGLYATAAVVTAVGAATKNEKLTVLGGVIGMGAGVAGAVSAANAASAADAVRTADSVYAGTAADLAPSASADAVSTASVASEAASSSLGEGAKTSPVQAEATPKGLLEAEGAPTPAAEAMAEPQAADPYGPGANRGADTLSAQGAPNDTNAMGGAPSNSPGDWWGGLKNTLEDVGGWMNKNPSLTKVGGGLIQGAMDYYGKQEMADDNLKRQKAYQDWVRQRYSESVRNLRVPAVTLTAPQNTGIIGGQRG